MWLIKYFSRVKCNFKDATKVFVQITTFSTVLNIMIWTIIMIAYLGYLRHDSKQHKESNYKMWAENTWLTVF